MWAKMSSKSHLCSPISKLHPTDLFIKHTNINLKEDSQWKPTAYIIKSMHSCTLFQSTLCKRQVLCFLSCDLIYLDISV